MHCKVLFIWPVLHPFWAEHCFHHFISSPLCFTPFFSLFSPLSTPFHLSHLSTPFHLSPHPLLLLPTTPTSLLLRESDITKERIKKILEAGANVILCTGGIDDLCLKYFVEAGAMAVRRVKKEDLKRIARATGGQQQFAWCEVYL